jgi:hypothetical protein
MVTFDRKLKDWLMQIFKLKLSRSINRERQTAPTWKTNFTN